ncbi:MAG: integrase family protein [Edaphobacter sp.]|nr:integrase family protein [Edaphobacter sp.]
MSRFQQGSLLKLKRKNSPDVWVFRWYDETNGTRTYKKRTLGKVTDMPLRRDAEKAVADFRANINVEVRVPQTVSDLAAHYRKYELTSDKKAFATIESTSIYLSRHIVPKWGDVWLSDIRTVEVEQWLHSLPYAPATRSKIRNIMSALFNHGIRHEWTHRNPITKVRASAKRLREPDVPSPVELSALITELPLREKAMVMLAGSTGLRRSELIALTWNDIDPLLIQVNVLRSCVRNHFGDTKTEASRRPVPLHSSVVECLNEWRKESKHNGDDDFLFRQIGKRENAYYARHGSQESHPPGAGPGEDHRQGDRMAQLPSLSGNQPESVRCGPEDSPGTPASRELPDHARHLHASDLRDETGCQQQNDGDGD